MPEIKNTVIDMKNALTVMIKGLDTAEERVSDLEHMSMETSQIEMR